MSGVNLGFAVEGLVTILLAVTVWYCFMLDKRLRRFRADEKGMRQTVVDLALATERAEGSIAGLRATLADADGSLVQRLRAAEAFTQQLDAQLKSGDLVLSRITKIVTSSRQVGGDVVEVKTQEEMPDSRSDRLAEMQAAARAMSERGASRHLSVANSHIQQTAA
jgi:Domain of unknown function (DUF6468)